MKVRKFAARRDKLLDRTAKLSWNFKLDKQWRNYNFKIFIKKEINK